MKVYYRPYYEKETVGYLLGVDISKDGKNRILISEDSYLRLKRKLAKGNGPVFVINKATPRTNDGPFELFTYYPNSIKLMYIGTAEETE